MSKITLITSLLLAVGLNGCFDPEFGEGGFHCDPAEGSDACPEGFRCTQFGEPGNFLCRGEGSFAPTISIALEKTEVSEGERLKVNVSLSNFTIDAAAVGSAPVAGHGHIHAFFEATPNEWEVKAETSFEVEQTQTLQPGPNKLIVQLFENNHQPVTPTVRAEASFTIVP